MQNCDRGSTVNNRNHKKLYIRKYFKKVKLKLIPAYLDQLFWLERREA
jgi:hypothetical protein